MLRSLAEGKGQPLPITESVVSQLRDKHPAGDLDNLPALPGGAPLGLAVNMRFLKRTVGRKIANGSAPDLFGWTGELLQTLMRDRDCLRVLALLVAHIRDGMLNDDIRALLLSAWLVPLDKGEGAVRPIAGGSCVFKMAACYTILQCTDGLVAAFALVQFGILRPEGCATALRLVQTALEADLLHCATKIDIRNAFNERGRKLIMDGVFARPALRGLWRLTHWAHEVASLLLIRSTGGIVWAVLLSQEGVRQGCVLASALFALSL